MSIIGFGRISVSKVENGSDAYSAFLSGYSISIPTNSSLVVTENVTQSINAYVCKGETQITDFTIGNISSPSGITISTDNINKTIDIEVLKDSFISERVGTIEIPIEIAGIGSVVQILSYSCSVGGENGVSFYDVTEHYLRSDQSTGITLSSEGWGTEILDLNKTERYLWNYETIIRSDGTTIDTTPKVIGVYGESGKDGVGIVSITNKYLISDKNVGVTITDTGWENIPPIMTADKRYLWNYETITYSVGEPKNTEPVIIGVYGDSGLNNATIYLYQRLNQTPTSPSSSITYNFKTKQLSGSMGKWVNTIPEGSDPLYTIIAIASSNQDSAVISPSDWCSPVMMAKHGDQGAALNTANVYLYQRSASKPDKPNSALIYDFESKTIVGDTGDWLSYIPDASDNSDPLYITMAVAASTESTDIIPKSEWKEPAIMAMNGDEGIGYSVHLEKETYAFAGDVVNALADSVSTAVIAYKNDNKIPVIVKSIDGISVNDNSEIDTTVDGLSAFVTNNDGYSDNTTITFTSDTNLTIASKAIPIVIEVDGKTFTKYFSYSISFKGEKGEPGSSASYVTTTVSSQIFKAESDSNIYTPSDTTITPLPVNCQFVSWEYSLDGGSTWQTAVTGKNGITIAQIKGKDNCLNIISNSVLFATTNIIPFRVNYSNNASDIVTIARLKDGSKGEDGTSPKIVSISANNQVFVQQKSGKTYYPSTASLTPVFHNCEYAKWQYTLTPDNDTSWVDVNNTHSMAVGSTNKVLTFSANSDLFSEDYNTVTFRVLTNDEGVMDSITIARVARGIGYTIILSNESYTFSGTETHAIEESVRLQLTGYWNSEKLPITITSIGGTTLEKPDDNDSPNNINTGITGLTADVTGNGSSSCFLTFNASANLVQTSGSVDIGILFNSETFNKKFSFSVALKGDPGENGVSLQDITEYYLISNKSTGITTQTTGWDTNILTVNKNEKYLWNYEVITKSDNSTITTSPKIIGVYGEGKDGVSIVDVINHYLVSPNKQGVTINNGEWQNTPPTLSAENKYLWGYETITYSEGDSKNTSPMVIGVYGDQGVPGEEGLGYTIVLGNESHQFEGTETTAKAGTTSTTIDAYKNTEKVPVTVVSIDGKAVSGNSAVLLSVNGLSATVSNNGSSTLNTAITFSATTSLTIASKAIPIVIEVDGKTFTKYFSYSISFKGEKGTSVSIKSTSVSYQVSTSGTVTPETWLNAIPTIPEGQYLWTKTVVEYTDGKSTTSYSVSRNGVNGVDGVNTATIYLYQRKASKPSQPVDGALTYTFKTKALTGTFGDWLTTIPNGVTPLYVTSTTVASANTSCSVLDWSDPVILVQNGANGTNGSDGVSVTMIETLYYLSTSSTTCAGGSWSTESPEWKDGKYIWTKTRTTFSKGDPVESSPACITGGKGATGLAGKSIVNVTPQYYLSDSIGTPTPTPTDDDWTDSPNWSYGKYVFTRNKIIFEDPADPDNTNNFAYTNPVCDTSWEVLTDLKLGGRNLVIESPYLSNSYTGTGGFVGEVTFVDDTGALCGKHVEIKCTSAGSGPSFNVFPYTNDKEGVVYTWSFYAKCSVNKEGNVGHECAGQSSRMFTTEWRKMQHTWRCYKNSNGNSKFTFYLNFAVGEILYIKDFKIEEGYNATTWTAAPEDDIARIERIESGVSGLETQVNELDLYIKNDIWKDNKIITYDAQGQPVETSTSEILVSHTQSLEGFNNTVSNMQTTINTKANQTTVDNLSTTLNQTASKIDMVIYNGTTQPTTSFTLTDKMIAAMTSQFTVKAPNGTTTIIQGGKINTNAIVGTNGTINLSAGTFTYGNTTKGIKWDGTNINIYGAASISGSLNAATGTFKGKLEAATGTFTGDVTATTFTAYDKIRIYNSAAEKYEDVVHFTEGVFYIGGDTLNSQLGNVFINSVSVNTNNLTSETLWVNNTATISGVINSSVSSGSYLAGNQGTAIINSTAAAGSYTMLAKLNSTNGYMTFGVHNTGLRLNYTAKTTVDAGTNSATKSIILFNESGVSTFLDINTGKVTASGAITTTGNITAAKFVSDSITPASGDKGTITVDGKILIYSRNADNNKRYPIVTAPETTAWDGCHIHRLYLDKETKSKVMINLEGGTAGGNTNWQLSVASTSDIRVKQNIKDCTIDALSLLLGIKMYEYDFTEDYKIKTRHTKVGLIADELEQLDEGLVSGGGYDEDGCMNLKTIDDYYLLNYTIKGVQELHEIIQNQSNTISELQNQNVEKDKEIESLKDIVNDLINRVAILESK